ncbi:MAG: RNA polymerase sigma factor [Acidobacteriota bacterium]|jgi:RNA polymerase sigma-70 factor (ECF subfamily)
MRDDLLIQGVGLDSDEHLLSRIRCREGEALLLVYRRYRLRVFALILRILKDRPLAEEVLQDVFQRLWDHHEKFDPAKGQLLAWLLTVARNISLDHKRKESRRAAHHVYRDEVHQLDPLPAMNPSLDPATTQSLRQLLETLPVEQKTVLELSYYEGLTHPELAEQLGESVGTIKTRIRLGMQKLKQAFHLGLA